MSRPVKWARDLHPIRERAVRSRTETWSRQDVEHLFGVGRATAQTLMKAVGEVQALAGAHFVERQPLLAFLEEMIAARSVEEALRERLLKSSLHHVRSRSASPFPPICEMRGCPTFQ